MYYKYKKICIKRAWPCGRAASGRVAWREELKKYAPKSAGFHCCRAGFQLLQRMKYAPDARKNGADGRFAAYKTKKKGQKKAEKRGWRAKIYGLAARQGSGDRSVVAASASLGAGLGVHFMPAAFRRRRGNLWDSLVCILFAGRIVLRCPASVCTFYRIVPALYAYFL